MSTEASSKKDLSHLKNFLVFAPDKTTEGSLDRRYQVRGEHLSNIKPHIEAGIVTVGGMFTDPEHKPQEGERLKALGSLLLVKAESLEDVRKLVEADVYYTSGVWDPERLLITPFFAATPFP